jgi:hypothetical protein
MPHFIAADLRGSASIHTKLFVFSSRQELKKVPRRRIEEPARAQLVSLTHFAESFD